MARNGVASDVALDDGSTVEGVVSTVRRGDALVMVDWARTSTVVDEQRMVRVADTVTGVVVWPVGTRRDD